VNQGGGKETIAYCGARAFRGGRRGGENTSRFQGKKSSRHGFFDHINRDFGVHTIVRKEIHGASTLG